MSVAFDLLKASIDKMKMIVNADKDNNKIFTQQDDSSTRSFDIVATQKIVQQLEQLIIENNLNAKIVIKELNASLHHPDYEQELKQLNLYLTDLEFDQALLSIQKISRALTGETSS